MLAPEIRGNRKRPKGEGKASSSPTLYFFTWFQTRKLCPGRAPASLCFQGPAARQENELGCLEVMQ